MATGKVAAGHASKQYFIRYLLSVKWVQQSLKQHGVGDEHITHCPIPFFLSRFLYIGLIFSLSVWTRCQCLSPWKWRWYINSCRMVEKREWYETEWNIIWINLFHFRWSICGFDNAFDISKIISGVNNFDVWRALFVSHRDCWGHFGRKSGCYSASDINLCIRGLHLAWVSPFLWASAMYYRDIRYSALSQHSENRCFVASVLDCPLITPWFISFHMFFQKQMIASRRSNVTVFWRHLTSLSLSLSLWRRVSAEEKR